MHALAVSDSASSEDGGLLPLLPWFPPGPSQMGSVCRINFAWEDSLHLAGLGFLVSSVQLGRHCPLWWLELHPHPRDPEVQHWLWPTSSSLHPLLAD